MQVVGTVVSASVAAAVAIWVGRRRGLDQVDARADAETRKLVEAQSARLTLLEAENARLQQRVTALTDEVADLREQLRLERMVTARFTSDGK